MERYHDNKSFKIFIVDDDVWFSKVLEHHLSANPEYEIRKFANATDFLKNIHENPQIVALDYSLPDKTGKEVLTEIKKFNPDLPVIIVSSQEDIEVAIDLLKKGAYDYVVKNAETNERLWNIINIAKQNIALKEEITSLKEEIVSKYDFSKTIIGNSDSIKSVYQLIDRATKINIVVSITGETGTGKELVAKAIHYNSNRAKQPFVAVNVTAIPKELIESELFGYEKGAFTGAITRRIGKFEEANKGTLFLDEIGELDLGFQAKLLRVLQEREIVRLGGNSVVPLDTRIIVATHKNLLNEVKNGKFREDLYYRLLGLTIAIPPLRERGNDVVILAKYFLEQFCKENKLPKKSFSPNAQTKLLKHAYPGNIRELKAVVELAVAMSDEETITSDHIFLNEVDPLLGILSNETTLQVYTEKIIQHFLEKNEGNVLLVAKKLGIGKTTIYDMIREGVITNKKV